MNFKQTIRTIFRNKTYSLLNILGLAIGITAAALILLWVEYQVNFNKSIPKHKNLYKIGQHQRYGDNTYTFFVSQGPLYETLKTEFPEIKQSSRYNSGSLNLKTDSEINFISKNGAYADPELFDMLSLNFLEGNPDEAFEPSEAIVISKSLAESLFGKESAIGQTIVEVGGGVYRVSGVFENLSKDVSFNFDWIIPFRVLEKFYHESGMANIYSWTSNWQNMYAELDQHANLDSINARLESLISQKTSGSSETKLFLYPLDKLRLYGEFVDGIETGTGFIRTVRLFFMIGLLILLIACINFMNLSTARSEKRALEVGVRKTFGSKRFQLVKQFMGESGLIVLIALLLSLGLIFLSLPAFNNLISGKLAFQFGNPYHTIGLIVIGLLCTFLAGSYPAFYLSAFSPIDTLKKLKKKGGSAIWIRKGLVVFQFAISFVLICATLVIYLQIRHGQSRPLGFTKENLIKFPITEELKHRSDLVRNELKNTGMIEDAGFSCDNIIQIWSNGGGYNWPGKDPENNPLISVTYISPGLIEAAQINISEGQSFSKIENREEVSLMKVIINRTLADMMGEAGHVGGSLGQGSGDQYFAEISGIVDDFLFNDLYADKVEPLIMFCMPQYTNYLYVRPLEGQNTTEVIEKTKNVLRNFSPNASFDAMFMEDTFDNMFRQQRLIGSLAFLFAGLAIFISCLGLFGLSAFSAEQRTKEIGIRKVLGASISDILMLLGKSFMALIGLSLVIAIPVAYYVSRNLIQDYSYKINLSWLIFAGVALLISLIAILTMSAQSLKAACSDPVNAIKTE